MSTPMREQFQQLARQAEAYGDLDSAISDGVRRRNRTFAVTTALGVAAAMMVVALIASDPFSSAAPQPLQPGPDGDRTPIMVEAKDVELVGGEGSGLGGQTLNISVEGQGGEVSGKFMITRNVISVSCADVVSDGVVVLGGKATGGPAVVPGELLALVIREGNPDSVSLYGNNTGSTTCDELLASMPADYAADDSTFVDVEDGYHITIR